MGAPPLLLLMGGGAAALSVSVRAASSGAGRERWTAAAAGLDAVRVSSVVQARGHCPRQRLRSAVSRHPWARRRRSRPTRAVSGCPQGPARTVLSSGFQQRARATEQRSSRAPCSLGLDSPAVAQHLINATASRYLDLGDFEATCAAAARLLSQPPAAAFIRDVLDEMPPGSESFPNGARHGRLLLLTRYTGSPPTHRWSSRPENGQPRQGKRLRW